MFANVEYGFVFNPDGADGIDLHLESSDVTLPEFDFLEAPEDVWPEFHPLRDQFFGSEAERQSNSAVLEAKAMGYRYMLFGRKRGVLGRAGLAEEPGQNSLVT